MTTMFFFSEMMQHKEPNGDTTLHRLLFMKIIPNGKFECPKKASLHFSY